MHFLAMASLLVLPKYQHKYLEAKNRPTIVIKLLKNLNMKIKCNLLQPFLITKPISTKVGDQGVHNLIAEVCILVAILNSVNFLLFKQTRLLRS